MVLLAVTLLIAISMMIFMLALAGVPPLSGFLSKLMMVSGIISSTVGDASGANLSEAMGSLSWVFWLAILVFINSAISLFYYLRICVVMFFEESERMAVPRALVDSDCNHVVHHGYGCIRIGSTGGCVGFCSQ